MHTKSSLWSPISDQARSSEIVAVKGVRSTHVGQGDCIAVVGEDRDGNSRPILYIDMGGGCGKCAGTHPDYPDFKAAQRRVDSTCEPKVMLSHWDKDHYFSATKISSTQELEWLVPRQKVGPRAAQFANSIKVIYCFPAPLQGQRFPLSETVDIYLERVGAALFKRAGDKNLTGLAFTLVRHDGSGRDLERIVMPADAPYQYIDSLDGRTADPPGGEISCLFAFHHGSKAHLTPKTFQVSLPAPDDGMIVFTYGLDRRNHNNFNHPAPQAIDFYRKKGWLKRINTASQLPASTELVNDGHDFGTGGDREVLFVRDPRPPRAAAPAPPARERRTRRR